ncbi:hypothetical protein LEP1GSC073_1904 [Leptospira noguchii str. Cascata]|nr:hypothetical protein LEP1GSC073_1904 [Leptospira noguchii str. Cascata]
MNSHNVFGGRKNCIITEITLYNSNIFKSFLRPKLFAGYSSRGFDNGAYIPDWFDSSSIRNLWSQEKIKELQLESVFPSLWEESYFFNPNKVE